MRPSAFNTERRFILNAGCPLYINKVFITNETLTDEIAIEYLRTNPQALYMFDDVIPEQLPEETISKFHDECVNNRYWGEEFYKNVLMGLGLYESQQIKKGQDT